MNLFRKSSRRWRGVDFMTLVPERTCGWTTGVRPGLVVILQPRFRGGLLGRFLQPRLAESKKYVRIPLEARGSFLWRRMDGIQTTAELAQAFAGTFPEERDQIPQRVATYLYQMVDNNLIRFVNFKA